MKLRLRHAPAAALLVTLGAAGCNEPAGPNGNGPGRASVIVLNSVGKTIQRFSIQGSALAPFGSSIVLPANYDGDAIDVLGDVWVSTISAAGGSQILFGSFQTNERLVIGFPGVAGALADPGAATIVTDIAGNIGALVATRATNQIWIAFPTGNAPVLIADNAGEFVERVLPAGQVLVAVDANLNDVGGTYEPLGDAKLRLFNFNSGAFFDEVELTGSVNATDGIFLEEDAFVLASGSFAGGLPAGDGSLVVVDANARQIVNTLPLQGNGISIEAGRNGQVYVTRTKPGGFETDVLSLNLFSQEFVNGPTNPIQPKNADGSDLSCWVATALIDSRLLCVTFSVGQPGRLVLLEASGAFLDDIEIGQGATDIHLPVF